MKILAIETSCDETAISTIEAKGGFEKPQFKIVSDTLISQINLHKKYGGVFPSLAKREHLKNLLPVLEKTLEEANFLKHKKSNSKNTQIKHERQIIKILDREPKLAENLMDFLNKHEIPKIDAVAVTQGPGLAPALWTGLNFAKALSLAWNKPLVPVNHMEGHIFSAFTESGKEFSINNFQFPVLALLLSGGHTELVLMKDWMKYKTVGQTRDDAVGEAYDKVARMLSLPYPGGPEISKLAEECKKENPEFKLPRPMIGTDDFNFSFSGLKTSVLYKVQKIKKLTPTIKKEISHEFENAVADVLLKKTQKAIEKYKIKTLILGGGVVANKRIRETFSQLNNKNLNVLIPEIKHSTDNAVMIGIAGYFRYLNGKALDPQKTSNLKADGNMVF